MRIKPAALFPMHGAAARAPADKSGRAVVAPDCGRVPKSRHVLAIVWPLRRRGRGRFDHLRSRRRIRPALTEVAGSSCAA
jgi:hypothetical protein